MILACALIYALIADMLWITQVVGPLYQKAFPNLIELKLAPAVFFYLLFTAGLTMLAIIPSRQYAWPKAISLAILFGLSVYGGYALTLLAVFKFFTWRLAALEMLWGAGLSIFVTLATRCTDYYLVGSQPR